MGSEEGMVVRVALAVRRNRFKRTGREGAFDDATPLSENELDGARAAIEAMKTPTPEMGDAFWSAEDPTDTGFRNGWAAAIVKALEE